LSQITLTYGNRLTHVKKALSVYPIIANHPKKPSTIMIFVVLVIYFVKVLINFGTKLDLIGVGFYLVFIYGLDLVFIRIMCGF
jgi:hypothetical protein